MTPYFPAGYFPTAYLADGYFPSGDALTLAAYYSYPLAFLNYAPTPPAIVTFSGGGVRSAFSGGGVRSTTSGGGVRNKNNGGGIA